MLNTERQSYIFSHDSVHNKVLCTNLSRAIDVSKDPICKISLELAKNGEVINDHEGILSNSFHKGYSSLEGAVPKLARALSLQLHTTLCAAAFTLFLNLSRPNIKITVIWG